MGDLAKITTALVMITTAFVIGVVLSSFLLFFSKATVYNQGWQKGVKDTNQTIVLIGLGDNDPCAIRVRKGVLAEMVTMGVQTGYTKCREKINEKADE